MFRRAAAELPSDIVTSFDARTSFFESGEEDAACAALQAWKKLDREMEAPPDIKGPGDPAGLFDDPRGEPVLTL